jgi:hypothetical protein
LAASCESIWWRVSFLPRCHGEAELLKRMVAPAATSCAGGLV